MEKETIMDNGTRVCRGSLVLDQALMDKHSEAFTICIRDHGLFNKTVTTVLTHPKSPAWAVELSGLLLNKPTEDMSYIDIHRYINHEGIIMLTDANPDTKTVTTISTLKEESDIKAAAEKEIPLDITIRDLH